MNQMNNPIGVSRTSLFPRGVAAESPSVLYNAAAVAADVIGSRSRYCYFDQLSSLGHERKGLVMGIRNWRVVSGFA